jgi:ubiquinone/menaquinone biosynthesis C-methylase UbiE
MLQQAKDKADMAGLKNTKFQQMDMEALEFPEQSFDVATSSFGLFFIEDMAAALTGIARTVKPGGKVAITSFTGEAFAPMSDIFIKHYEATGRTAPPLSWKRLATPELIEAHFNAAGITDISIHHEPLGYQMTSAQQWWDVVWNAGWRSLLSHLSQQEQKEFKQAHLEEVEQVIGSDGVWFNTEVLIAVGSK